MVNGKLLQMDKKYKHLKQFQKEQITQWMFEETKLFYQKNYVFPNEKQVSEVIDRVYARIEDAEIRIPYSEISKRYRSKRSDINKRVRREMNLHEDHLRRHSAGVLDAPRRRAVSGVSVLKGACHDRARRACRFAAAPEESFVVILLRKREGYVL